MHSTVQLLFRGGYFRRIASVRQCTQFHDHFLFRFSVKGFCATPRCSFSTTTPNGSNLNGNANTYTQAHSTCWMTHYHKLQLWLNVTHWVTPSQWRKLFGFHGNRGNLPAGERGTWSFWSLPYMPAVCDYCMKAKTFTRVLFFYYFIYEVIRNPSKSLWSLGKRQS